MRWSIEELRMALGLYKSYGFARWFIELPKRLWKRLKVFFKWLFKGYTDISIWDLKTYLLEVTIFRLDKFIKHSSMSYPYEFEDRQGWVETLKELYTLLIHMKDETYITSIFEKYSDIPTKKVEEHKEELQDAYYYQKANDEMAAELFIKHFKDLWD